MNDERLTYVHGVLKEALGSTDDNAPTERLARMVLVELAALRSQLEQVTRERDAARERNKALEYLLAKLRPNKDERKLLISIAALESGATAAALEEK